MAEEQTDTQIGLEAVTKTEEDTKIPEDNVVKNDAADETNSIINELYYVYYKNQILGPHDPKGIIRLFVATKIENECWIKSLKFNADNDKWCKVMLSKTEATSQNQDLRETYPELHAYLVPKLSCEPMKQYDPPVDAPKGALSKLSIVNKIIQVIGRIIAGLALLWIGAHVLPTLCFALCCWGIPGYFLCGGDTDEDENKLFGGIIFISYLGLPIMPFLVVYVVLLGEVDDPNWNGELQSWMIAYLAWGIASYLFTVGIVAGGIAGKKGDGPSPIVRGLANTMFWIIGVDFGELDPMQLLSEYVAFAMAGVFLFPALAALLPSAIIGFISNFVLEEKFELKCDDNVENSTLCYGDQGCCEVISSHDWNNSYEFIGGLASNILATWAVIRITGYLMVNIIPETSMFAKRNN